MKNYILFAVILFSPVFLLAQSNEDIMSEDSTWIQTFADNLYIEFDAGTQLLFSQDVENLGTKDRYTPYFALKLGKWFSPVWGVELKIEGYSLNGFSTTEGEYSVVMSGLYDADPVRNEVTINPDGTYRHFIRYINTSVNLFASLVSLSGYDENIKFDCIPFLGIGNMHVFDYKGIPSKNTLSVNVGIMGKYRFAPRWDLNMKISSAFFDDDFEGRIAGDKDYDKYLTGSVGIVYYFKRRGFDRLVTQQ